MLWIAEMPTGKRILDSYDSVRDCLQNGVRVYRVTGLSLETTKTLDDKERQDREDRRLWNRFG